MAPGDRDRSVEALPVVPVVERREPIDRGVTADAERTGWKLEPKRAARMNVPIVAADISDRRERGIERALIGGAVEHEVKIS